MSDILQLLKLVRSEQSVDYVENKNQFHLFSLVTEQRHPNTWNLGFTVQRNTEAGLKMILSVDQDISAKITDLLRDPSLLEQTAQAVAGAVLAGRRVYFYGCGATGRLAKQMESSFWRPFWRKVRRHALWSKLHRHLPGNVEDLVIGEMTGADRALVSSLEGFEDLQLIGRLQLRDRQLQAGDAVLCVTEGGETSSVIGTVLAALQQHGDLDESSLPRVRRLLYFVYNNPDEVLRPFDRSAAVIDQPAITRINLTTGPQAITGSTRMQATTIETFVIGAALEEAIYRILKPVLTGVELGALGFAFDHGVAGRLASFDDVKAAVDQATASIARLTELEAHTYRDGRLATYYAETALITVFIDNTERSPTFRLYPLDRAQDPERRCWVQVWTKARDAAEAWRRFLGRPFRGLEDSLYRGPFALEIPDPYLREAALRSLANAGNDQELAYDFSFSDSNIRRKGPKPGDLGVAVLMDDEVSELLDPGSSFRGFVDLVHESRGRLAVVVVAGNGADSKQAAMLPTLRDDDLVVRLRLPAGDDPLTLRRQIALKMMLNAHSTAVMASLGKVVGNTMTSVSPSNLKLIGRATHLIIMHVNDTIDSAEWVSRHGRRSPLTFAEANAVLFDAIAHLQAQAAGQTAEVALSIIRILEALRRQGYVSWEAAQEISDREGLAAFLVRLNPSLGRDVSGPARQER